MMTKELNIWFSRHEPTESQINEIGKEKELIFFSDLASVTIDETSFENFVNEFFRRIYDLKGNNKKLVLNIYGVIPPILRSILLAISDLTNKTEYGILIFTLESWNIQRSKEGEKPAFLHKKFICTGYYYLPSYLSPSPDFINSIITAYK